MDAILPGLAACMQLEMVKHDTMDSRYMPFTVSGRYHLLVDTRDRTHTPEKLASVIQEFLNAENVAERFLQMLTESPRRFNLSPLYQRENFAIDLRLLLFAACRYRPLAMPFPEFTWDSPLPEEGADFSAHSPRPCQIKLSNERYNISIVASFDAASHSATSYIHQAILDYCVAIWKLVKDDSTDTFHLDRNGWKPAEFAGQALSELSWGDFRFPSTPVADYPGGPHSLQLYKVEMRSENRGRVGRSIVFPTEKASRMLALVHACAYLKGPLQEAHKDGTLVTTRYSDFAKYWEEIRPDLDATGSKNPQQNPIDINNVLINEKIVGTMFGALRELVQNGFQSTYDWSLAKASNLESSVVKSRSLKKNASLDRKLRARQLSRLEKATSSCLDLPVLDDDISSTIKESIGTSDVTIITAATGSGKTTQIPQLILDQYIADMNGSMCSIICTQPRRISTISVATRVASERQQPIGKEIGYRVRFDARPTSTSSGIMYMTTGYLVRLLEQEPVATLQRASHIIIDEVHTRDVDTDMLLTVLKNILSNPVAFGCTKPPKIILMSATIESDFFRQYFEDLGPRVKISSIDVPGKMFPIEVKTFDSTVTELQANYPRELGSLQQAELGQYIKQQMDYVHKSPNQVSDEGAVPTPTQDVRAGDTLTENQPVYVPVPLLHLLIAHLLATTESGDFLVFLPGMLEIEQLEQLLLSDSLTTNTFSESEKCRIFKLHSALYETNYGVFEDVPAGCRRVILATNIAETSITLPNVKYVLDTGLSRQATFDQVALSGTFGLRWISKAEVAQRKGRAGRTHPGDYYPAFSQAQYDSMAETQTPEMLKTSLDRLVLRSSSSPAYMSPRAENPAENGRQPLAGQALLASPSPPELAYVDAAAQQLRNMRALDDQGNATAMGAVLSALPMDPAPAKAMLLGTIFRCLDAMMLFGSMRDDLPIVSDSQRVTAVTEMRRKLADLSDDDKWADSRAFFLFNEHRRLRQRSTANEIQQSLSIRYDAYCEQAQICKQTFDMIRPMLGLPLDYDDVRDSSFLPKPLFPFTPAYLNTNSQNANIVKALALSTSGTRLARWTGTEWNARNRERVIPTPRSVNHFFHGRRSLLSKARREPGDIISYGNMRKVPKDRYPWLHETSIVTPLTGILFAESVAFLEDDSTFIINNELKYKINVTASRRDPKFVAKVIWEYRKALDRFFALSMQLISLQPQRLQKVRSGELRVEDFNAFFKKDDHPYRKIVVESVIQILDQDASDRAERTDRRIEAIESRLLQNQSKEDDNEKP